MEVQTVPGYLYHIFIRDARHDNLLDLDAKLLSLADILMMDVGGRLAGRVNPCGGHIGKRRRDLYLQRMLDVLLAGHTKVNSKADEEL